MGETVLGCAGAVPCLSPQEVCRGTCHQDRERRPGSGDPQGLCPHLGRGSFKCGHLRAGGPACPRVRETGGPAPLAQSLLGPSLLRISRCRGQGPPASPGGVRPGVFAGGRTMAETGTPLLSPESQGGRCTSYWPPSGTERGGAPCRPALSPAREHTPTEGDSGPSQLREDSLPFPPALPSSPVFQINAPMTGKPASTENRTWNHLSLNAVGLCRAWSPRPCPALAPGDIWHCLGTCGAGRTGRGSWPRVGGGRPCLCGDAASTVPLPSSGLHLSCLPRTEESWNG